MSISNANESPIVNSPASVELADGYDDIEVCGGAQWMPVSQLGLYLKFVVIICGVFGLGAAGVYMLLQWFSR
ncbi:MAG: hypothetical protein H6R04_835 [Burkholderiaceae bacterium]|nr:hypothetical protein [Burkholderiaceae bacterium]